MSEWVGVAELAAAKNVTEQAVSRACREGRLPGARRVESRWRIPVEAAAEWMPQSLLYAITREPTQPLDLTQPAPPARVNPWKPGPAAQVVGAGDDVLDVTERARAAPADTGDWGRIAVLRAEIAQLRAEQAQLHADMLTCLQLLHQLAATGN